MKMSSRLCLALAFIFALACKLPAQRCFTFTPSFSAYASSSSDGTNLYTSVTVDGSGSMNITGGNGCGSINYGNAVHTPMAVNVIATGSTYVGGQQTGSGGCPSCYISETNYQQMAMTAGTTYTFTAATNVYCNFGGSFFGVSWFPWNIELAYTKSKWNNVYTTVLGGGVQCYVSQWCTVASQPPLCDPAWVIQEPLLLGTNASCRRYYNTTWFAESYNGGPWNCFGLLPEQSAIGTDDSSVMTCTKHP